MKTSEEITQLIWDKFDWEFGLSDMFKKESDIGYFNLKIQKILSDWEDDIVNDCDMTS